MSGITKDITTREDIQVLVDAFYTKVRRHPEIGPIFDAVIGDRWPQHLEKMYAFWETVLLERHTYFGSPFPPHAKLPVDQLHFDAWLDLWRETIDAHFQGTVAAEAKWRAGKMAAMFLSKIRYYRDSGKTPLI
ncbi:group III truncated hemoglobin [Niabella beijingensis]|uniref:group III truncated hemoglobin n=1 Tax=Niabella beijingensis TaxID=2872700 RepID=UPI001CBAD014|nr:group III truncated hemoglobin [Niabella beijingensis]MBZ4190374.1 group III truncated hemoglobin [Niabella beijingensis]